MDKNINTRSNFIRWTVLIHPLYDRPNSTSRESSFRSKRYRDAPEKEGISRFDKPFRYFDPKSTQSNHSRVMRKWQIVWQIINRRRHSAWDWKDRQRRSEVEDHILRVTLGIEYSSRSPRFPQPTKPGRSPGIFRLEWREFDSRVIHQDILRWMTLVEPLQRCYLGIKSAAVANEGSKEGNSATWIVAE